MRRDQITFVIGSLGTVRLPRSLAGSAWFALCCLSVAASGCSSSLTGSSGTEPAKASVVKFLDAMKRGDETVARDMLTRVARVKTEELGVSVAPPVGDTAAYTVRECEMVSETNDLAHVATTWSDIDETGATTSENIIWAVRLDPEGWRVVGMAMKIFEDMPPLLLNFEDPQDMLAKQEMVAAELTKRAAQAKGQATEPRTARGPAQAPAQVK
ncbi:MAG: hypothetical protein K8S94_06450 [Planctomycetia bacterium]|nr:hypothetical protein [Planctomycetia bacterium]